VVTIFLNCTKNTELTARHFARTFGLALKQKLKPNSADDNNRPDANCGIDSLLIGNNHHIHHQKTEN
jgi:hypothetical protein